MNGANLMRVLAADDPGFAAALDELCARATTLPEEIEAAARRIVADVRARGDAALRELTERFEGRSLATFELPRAEWTARAATAAPAVRAIIERAAARIRTFHERERYATYELEEAGVRLASRVTPLGRVGIYVPGGTALYPSTVIMTAIPARVAGVGEIVMTTPGPSPEALAAAEIAGVDRVFVLGGAQAVAALAYGTASVPRVDKIVGPGNAYVAAAKKIVFGDVGIDAVAGPTEVVVVADGTGDAQALAADLLAQAEHDKLAVPILITIGREMAEATLAALPAQLATLPRREIASVSLRERGAVIVTTDVAQALAVADRLAPEHLELCLADARGAADRIRNAGAIFVGPHTPEAAGDYFAGPSHVLPTSGSARFASPLGVADFVKRTSIIEYTAAALAAQADDIERFAAVENLDGHGRAVAVRVRGLPTRERR